MGPSNSKLTKEELKELIKTWGTRAEMARKQGNQDLVRQALERKQQYENELARRQEFDEE